MIFCISLFIYGVLTSILINFCVYFAVDYSNQTIEDFNDHNLAFINNVAADWETSPFIDIIDVESDACPSSHPDLVFSRPFYGSDLACDCQSGYPNNVTITATVLRKITKQVNCT